MNCRIATQDEYDLWALGLLDEPKADDIATHLRSGCPECTRALRGSASLLAAVAYTQAAGNPAVPPRHLRERILAEVAPQKRGRVWSWDFIPRWMSPALAAALVLLIAFVALRPRPTQAPEIAQLQSEVQEWRRRAETAMAQPVSPSAPIPAPAPAPSEAPPRSATPAPPQETVNPAIERELAEVRQQAATANDALAAERNRAAQLQKDLDSARALASAATSQRDEVERKLNASANDPRLSDRDRQVAALTTQVRQLEQENARYRESILRLERQANRDTRLVALLNSPSAQLVKLQASEAGGRATGRAIVAEGQKMVFYASNMPQLPAGRTYQLWLMRGRRPAIASGGVFGQDGSLEVSDATLLSDLRGLAVTEEPAGGSPGPTGHKILVGTL